MDIQSEQINIEVFKAKQGRKKASSCSICGVLVVDGVKFRNGKCCKCFNEIQKINYQNKLKDYHKQRYLEKTKDKPKLRNRNKIEVIEPTEQPEENNNLEVNEQIENLIEKVEETKQFNEFINKNGKLDHTLLITAFIAGMKYNQKKNI